MPQMAPLNWLILFMYFSMVFLAFNMMNFYSFNYSIKKSNPESTKLTYNWKW